MITRVKLKNWRSHLDSEFNFSSGTNALLGDMGAGKTSVTDSICFALFGTFPTLQAKKLKLDDIIMKKPIEKNGAETEVFFQVDGTIYSVKRIIEKGKGTTYSEFRENGKLIEAPNSQRVTELVEKTLKVDYELFSKAIYSEQNALDYFLTVPKGQRMKKIDELLMIDRFEVARASAVTLANRMVERKLGKESIVEQINLEVVEKNMSELKNSLIQILSERDEMKKRFEETGREKDKTEKEVFELQKIREGLELLKREESGIKSAVEEALNSIRALEFSLKGQTRQSLEKILEEMKKGIEGLEDKLKGRKESYEKISSLASESKAKLEFLKKEKIERLEKEIGERLRVKMEFERLKRDIGEEAEKKFEKEKSLYEKLVGEIQEIKSKIRDFDETVEKLSSLEGKCPVCESKLSEERKRILIEQKQLQIEELKERLSSVSKKKELSEKELEKLEEAKKKLDEMMIEIKDFDEIKNDLESSKRAFIELSESTIKTENQLSGLRKEIERMESELKESASKRQELEILSVQQKDYEEKRKRLDELLNTRKSVEEKIVETEKKIVGRDLAELEKKLRKLIASEKEAETRISGLDQIIMEKEARIKEHELKASEAKKQKEEVEKLEKVIKDLKIFEKALERTQVELRTEFIEAVNYTMNKIWPTLYPYQDFTGINLSIEEGDYLLKLKEKAGRFVNVEGVASGGERSIACLALRVAFALALAPHIRLLVLDEPSHNLDTAALKELAATLRERISEFISQIFLITHQAELEDAVTGNAYRLERDKSRDGVTKVIAIT